ncbi:MAG: hypothetical protein IJY65_03925 [Clostridia bacterium]|nr:hypothetical protein [Clostridia bacterium]
MKVNREQLEAYAALSDEALWSEIRKIAGAKGFNLPEAVPSHAEMMKIRSAMLSVQKLTLTDALRMVNEYKRSNRE